MIYKMNGLDYDTLGDYLTKCMWKKGLKSTNHGYIFENGGIHMYFFFDDFGIIIDRDYEDLLNRFEYVEQAAEELYTDFLFEYQDKMYNEQIG